MKRRQPFPTRARRPAPAAFSLVEMMAVVAIIGIMMVMIAPSISSFSSTAGRKGAVNILMNTLEQARAAALETGSDIYVLLWRREYPERDAIMVVRQPSQWMTKRDGTIEDRLVPLTRWISLPEGVLLHQPKKGENIFSSFDWPPLLQTKSSEIPAPDGGSFKPEEIGVVWFTGDGSIRKPTGKKARIVISEGVRDGSRVEALISNRKQDQGQGGGFDVISLSRFTGRANLDVTTLE